MKHTFKISALAIVVASLTACKIGSSNSNPTVDTNQKTPLTAESLLNLTQTTPAKTAKPAPKTDPVAEATKPTEKPNTVAEQPKLPNTITQPTKVEKPFVETSKSQDTEKPIAPLPKEDTVKEISLDSQGKSWRIIKMSGAAATKNVYARLNVNGIGSILAEQHKDICGLNCVQDKNEGIVGYRQYGKIYNAGSSSKGNEASSANILAMILGTELGKNADVRFNLDELAQKDGNKLLGLHSGSYTNSELSGYVFEAYTNDKGELVTNKKPGDTVNYLFVNQPYSSYGMIFTNENDINEFYIVLAAGDGKEHYLDKYAEYTDIYKTTEKNGVVWNDNIKGEATYKGNIIAYTHTYMPPHFKEKASLPKLDGTIVLNAHFNDGEGLHKSYVEGEVNSQTVGKFNIPQSQLDRFMHTVFTRGFNINPNPTSTDDRHMMAEIKHNDMKGYHRIAFGGKDLNDVVGDISLFVDEKKELKEGDITRYQAVFGATKQPK